MRRGVYFDAWFSNQHNYHPSLPARRLRMIDQLEDMRATTLVWAALGGGSISLPYLEQEAYEPVPARFRMHGHVNDSEFLARCRQRGIEVFGVIFEAQGWEFGAEYDDDGRLVSLNETRGAGRPGTVGLREFNADTGPADWKPWRHYFPDGIVNSLGEQVTNIWEDATSRALDGRPLHANWVECADRDQTVHLMDRNSPVWREYLKAIARIQIDAGVSGVQLDESEIPLNALYYGGCFCKDCTAQFRDYLQHLDPADQPAELDGVDLTDFDYGAWLRGQGYEVFTPVRDLPLAKQLTEFHLGAMHRSFRELTDYIRQYAASQGRQILISGNFYNGHPEYDGIVDCVDVMITEMHATAYKQPWWFRHVAGLARGRDVLIAQNPYGGIIPELVEAVNDGKSYDRLRTTFYEGAATGPSMTFPFGSWMGTEIEDAFWAPKHLLDEVGQALEATDQLRGATSAAEVAVLYPLADAWRAELAGPRWATAGTAVDYSGIADDDRIAYWRVIKDLALAHIPFDVIPLPDPRYRDNDVTADALDRYRYVVVPDCQTVSLEQHTELVAYAAGGGAVVVLGDYGNNLDASTRALLTDMENCLPGPCDQAADLITDRQVRAGDVDDLYVGTFAVGQPGAPATAIHLLNYAYDADADAAARRRDIALDVRLAHPVSRATLWRPGHDPEPIAIARDGSRVSLTLPELEIYAVVELV